MNASDDEGRHARRGELIGTMLRSEIESDKLIDMMIGSAVETLSASTFVASESEPVLLASDLWVKDDRKQNAVQGLNLSVQRGQIVGIGGIDENGQVELAEALAGVRRIEKGTVTLGGIKLEFDQTFVGYVPQNRQVDGLATDLNLIENMAVSSVMNGMKFSRKEQAEKAAGLIAKYSIKAKSAIDLAKQLSGGNQQKVILARVLDQNPEVLVVVNPTRGLDVKAAGFVHRKLLEAAEKGAYVVVITTDREELFAISDQQWYLSRGKLYADEKEALAS